MGNLGAEAAIAAAKKYGLDRQIQPIAITATLLPGFDPDDDRTLLVPSMLLTPSPHPVFEAYMAQAGALKRGRMSWAVGLAEERYNPDPLRVVTTRLREGSVFPENLTLNGRGKPIDLSDVVTHRKAHDVRQMLYGTPAAFSTRDSDVLTSSWSTGTHGAVTLSVSAGVLWIKVITTPLDLDPDDEIGLPDIELNLRPAGKTFTDPKPARPAEAMAILDRLAEMGVTVVDPDESQPIRRLRDKLRRSVVITPLLGRPAIADVSIGQASSRNAPVDTVLGRAGRVGFATRRIALPVMEIAAELRKHPAASVVMHPGSEDICRMVEATRVEDDTLRPYQQEAVGLHMATKLGYLLAPDPGMGKTVIQYRGMQARAKTIRRYRALVVCESTVRPQWVEHARVWFPEATVVSIESRTDSAKLLEALTNTRGPVVTIVSYALLGAVSDTIEARAAAPASRPWAAKSDLSAAPLLPACGLDSDQLDLFSLDMSQEPCLTKASELPDEPELALPGLGEILLDGHWHDIAADEGDVLSNSGSKQTAALWALRPNSDVAVVLTGTPITKSLDDLGRILAWVRNDQHLFHGARLSRHFDVFDDVQLAEFWSSLGPLVFRRDSSEITDELPNIYPTVMLLDPTLEEKALSSTALSELKRVYQELLAWLDIAVKTNPDDASFAEAKESLKAARGAWLGGTTLARMAASDPAALLGSTSAAAALLAGQGLVAAANRRPGTKRTAVVRAIAERVEAGGKILVFTDYVTVAKGVIDDLNAAGIRVGAVVGGGGKARDRTVVEFQAGDLDVLVCTSAGNRGLNLQRATCVVHYDLPWTPDPLVQRVGRAFRIGSTSKRLEILIPLMRDTIEERVASVVVNRAVESMRALDASRGVDISHSELAVALSGLSELQASSDLDGDGSELMQMTRALVA